MPDTEWCDRGVVMEEISIRGDTDVRTLIGLDRLALNDLCADLFDRDGRKSVISHVVVYNIPSEQGVVVRVQGVVDAHAQWQVKTNKVLVNR